MSDRFALICGSAVVQIIAKITDFRPPTDHSGPIKTEFGGCAYNTAVNLRTLGTPSVFLSAMNRGPFSRMIMNQLRTEKVRTFIKEESSLGDALHTSIVHKGEKTAAVSSNVHDHIQLLPEDYEPVLQDSTACVVMTCDFPAETISNIAEAAGEKNIPVIVVGASQRDCLKIAEQRVKAPYYFLTQEEMSALSQNCYQTNDWLIVAQELNATFLVFLGKKGVSIYSPNGRETVTSDSIAVTGTSLGASDLMLSGIVHYHLFEDYDLKSAIEASFGHMESILSRDHTNLSSSNSVEQNIQSIITNANEDELTGIPNRTGFKEAWDLVKEEDGDLYLLLMDIDHFKSINDNHGHDIGDEVLTTLAMHLKLSMRDGDILARWGGEEFICIFRGESIEEAVQLAERIRQSLESMHINSLDRAVTVSGGVAQVDKSEPLEKSIKKADLLLYQAKEAGRNRILCED